MLTADACDSRKATFGGFKNHEAPTPLTSIPKCLEGPFNDVLGALGVLECCAQFYCQTGFCLFLVSGNWEAPLRAGRSPEPTRSAVLVFWGSSPPCGGLFYFWPSFFNSFLNTFLVSSFFFQKRLLGRMDPRFCLWIK